MNLNSLSVEILANYSWLCLHLDLLAKSHPHSCFGGWLHTSLDPGEAWNREDAVLLYFCCGKGCQALKESRAHLRLQLMLFGKSLDKSTFSHDFACLCLHCLLHRCHGCGNKTRIDDCFRTCCTV